MSQHERSPPHIEVKIRNEEISVTAREKPGLATLIVLAIVLSLSILALLLR
jgi:hypothetical protein